MNLLAEVGAAIRTAYGNPESPTYAFVTRALKDPRYRSIVAELQRHFDDANIDDDPNIHVSVAVLLRKGDDHWAVSLSLVGPFAAVYRVGAESKITVITPDVANSSFEHLLFDRLAANGFTALPLHVLETPIALRLIYTEPTNVRIYQALFSDTDLLPWELPRT